MRVITKQEASKEYPTIEAMQKAINTVAQEIDGEIDACVQDIEEIRQNVNTLRQNFVRMQVENISREQITRPITSQNKQVNNIYPKCENHAEHMQSVHLSNINNLKKNENLLLKSIKTPSVYKKLDTPLSDYSNPSSVIYSLGGRQNSMGHL